MAVQLATDAPSQVPSLCERIAEYKDPIIKVALAALFFGGISMMVCGGIHHNPWLAFGGALSAASGFSLSMDYSSYKNEIREENKSIIKIYQIFRKDGLEKILEEIPLPTAEEIKADPNLLAKRAKRVFEQWETNKQKIDIERANQARVSLRMQWRYEEQSEHITSLYFSSTTLKLTLVSRLPRQLSFPDVRTLDLSQSPHIKVDRNFYSQFPRLERLTIHRATDNFPHIPYARSLTLHIVDSLEPHLS